MATKLFLRSTQNNGIGATYFDMLAAAGSATSTATVNTAASGTEIQWTQTGGGSLIQWISGRAPSGGFTLTSTDISIWAAESNGQANAGGRYRVFKRAANGTETELGGGPFSDGVEFGTSAAEMTWTGNVTDTAFAEDDRILLKVYITNVGTMGASRTCTLTYNGADAATGDSFLNLAETITFKAESVTHAASGDAVGQGSTLAGSAAHIAVHASSGALSGQGAVVAGSAARTRLHSSTGALAGQGPTIAGSSARTRVHSSSGVLAGQTGVVAGSASRSAAIVTHDASGTLTGQTGSVSGAAARLRAFGALGALIGQGSVLAGNASRSVSAAAHNATGRLEGERSILTAAVKHPQVNLAVRWRRRRLPRNDYGFERG